MGVKRGEIYYIQSYGNECGSETESRKASSGSFQ